VSIGHGLKNFVLIDTNNINKGYFQRQNKLLVRKLILKKSRSKRIQAFIDSFYTGESSFGYGRLKSNEKQLR
jgi:hypothetical protein